MLTSQFFILIVTLTFNGYFFVKFIIKIKLFAIY